MEPECLPDGSNVHGSARRRQPVDEGGAPEPPQDEERLLHTAKCTACRAAERGDCPMRHVFVCLARRPRRALLCLWMVARSMMGRMHLRPGSIRTPEDLVQDLTVRVAEGGLRTPQGAESETPLGAWVRGVLRNLVARDRRARRRADLSQPEQVVDVALGPVSSAELADDLRVLEVACAALPPEYESLVRLQRLGLAWQERLEWVRGWEPGVSARTLRRRLRRARQALRDHQEGAFSSGRENRILGKLVFRVRKRL